MLLLAGAAYVAWGALYIHRASFVVDGERVFCLWDDGMIAMHYARNLARGHGLVWNAGQPAVQGFTNLGVTLVMAALHELALPAAKAALPFQVLNLGLLAGIATLVFGVCRRVFPQLPQVAVAATLACLVSAPSALWSLQGSDAAFVSIWIMGCVYAAASPARRGKPWPWWLFGMFAAGLFIRADAGLAYVLLCGGAAMTPGPRRRRMIVGAGVLVGVTAGLLAFNQLYYGDWLPNTYYLKATGSPRGLVLTSGLHQLWAWLPALVPSLALAGWATWHWRREALVCTASAIILATLAYCVWVGGDWAPQYGNRLFAPCLPLVAILSAAGLHPLVTRALVDWKQTWLPWGLAGTAIAVALVGNPGEASAEWFGAEWFGADAPSMYRAYNERNYRRAVYLREHTSADTIIGVHWAGVPVYFSERPAVDLLGKSDRHIAKQSVPRFFPGHSKWDWDYVMDVHKPDIFLITTRGLGQRTDYLRDYVVVRRDGEVLFSMRRESLHKLHDSAATIHAP